MGNDGGVIAVKRKFMRHGNMKARGEKVDQEALRLQRTQTCALSEEPLREPIVCCALGNLYNKQAVLEALLAKSLPPRFQHITSLKDVVTCQFTHQSDSTAATATTSDSSSTTPLRFCCPVTMLEFTGKQPFVVLPACGCVVSERSLKEVQTRECLVCGTPTSSTAAPIALAMLDDAEYERRQQELLVQKAHDKQQSRKEKRKRTAGNEKNTEETSVVAANASDDTSTKVARAKGKKHKRERQAARTGITSTTAALPSSKIVQDAASAIEKEKAKSAVFASLFTDTTKRQEKKSANELLMTVAGLRYTLS